MTKFSGASVKVGVKVTLVIYVLMLIAQVVFAFGNASGRLEVAERSVAVDNSGNVYVYGNSPYYIQKLDPQGNFVASWGSYGTGDGQFNISSSPNSIAIDSNNNVYVLDKYQYRVQKFDNQGHFLTKWGSQGTGDSQFGNNNNRPCGLSVDNQANVYVFDCGNYRVQKFDSQGHFLLKWGSQGNGDAQFSYPYGGGITVDKQGNVYVVDIANKLIKKFDGQGRFLLKWGGFGKGPGQFGTSDEVGPFGLATDNQLNVYVSDGYQIQKFDSQGHYLGQWDVTKDAWWPSNDRDYDNSQGMAVDKQGTVYTVANLFNNYYDEIGDTGYYNVHLQTFDSNGHFLKRWGDRFYLPWWFVFTVPPAIGFLVSYLHAKRKE